MTLTREQYDDAYFGDPKSDLNRRSGYSDYLRTQTDSYTAKKWKDFIVKHNLKPTDKILELAGGIGHFTKVAREQGLDVTCVDWSQWCFDNKIIPDLIHEDALTYLKSQPDNSFDVVVSFFFLDCIQKDQIELLSKEIKRVTTKQIHQIYPRRNADYYNVQNLSYWQSLFSQDVIVMYKG